MIATEYVPRPTRCFPNLGLRITLHKKESKGSRSSPSSSSGSSHFSSLGSSSFALRKRTREEELKEVFRHFDMDKDGKISPCELRRYFASVGERMSEEDAHGVIEELDSDQDGMLDFQDFVKLMDAKEGADDDLKEVFEMFEEEKGSGRITPKGLQRALSSLGDFKSYDECVAMIQAYDIDGLDPTDLEDRT
ncbi:hypothetical protein Cgig2_007306 [Carnegiea gigantea]|uniref:EF-hand domain-containing protein n=1 Tax=Carnegiea gigantea TaxID=171969 RepID=A0A9Q1KYC2_9CARY|nr:hypothetical protein Cgig2_007306 [Carnegiea gigantea]